MSWSCTCDCATSLTVLLLSFHLLSSTAEVVVNTANKSRKDRMAWNVNQTEHNNMVPLNKLQKIFDPANCSHAETTCKTLLPTQVSDYLEHEVNRSVEKLCLKIKPRKKISSFHERTIYLDALTQLHSLMWLQIMPEQGKLGTNNQVRIFYPANYTVKLPLKELHITIPIYHVGVETFAPFLHILDNLRVLNLANTLKILKDGLLEDILSELEGKPLIALSLQSFQSLTYYRESYTPVLNVTGMLWPLRSCPLQYLDLSKNDFLEALPGIYTVASGLRILDYSQNNLIINGNQASLIELLMHPNLEILYINNQGCNDRLKSGNFRNMQPTQQFHSEPQFSILRGSFLEDYLTCKHKLRINSTEERQKYYFCQLLYCINPELLKGIPCTVLPSWDDLFPLNFSCRFSVRIPISKSLETLDASNLNIFTKTTPPTKRNTLCLYPNSFQKLTFSSNGKLLEGLLMAEEMKYTRISGLEQVTYIDLSNNGLQVSLENEMLHSFPRLQYLYLSGNLISTSNSHICKSNRFLKTLDLSHNNLNTSALNLHSCHFLEQLYLSHNKLGDLDIDLSSIHFINASSNKITKLSQKTIRALINLSKKFPVTLDLSNNPWDCGCSRESINSIEFMQNAKKYRVTLQGFIHYQCYRLGSYSFLSSIKVSQLTSDCYPSHILLYVRAVTITTSVILVFLIFYMSYRCRYRINTCYFHTCQWIHKRKNVSERDKLTFSNIKYDAFVSYASEDRFWVHDVLMPELEGTYGLQLCLHYRDFPAHGDLVDVIIKKIQQSRCIVVVLSKFSVIRPWCDYELKSAHAQHLLMGKDLIIIKLGDIPNDLELTDLVRDLLNSQVYIEWPEVGLQMSKLDHKRQSVFWGKIQRAIYGEEHCSCMRYCNPLYNRNDPLRVPILEEYDQFMD